LFLSFILLYLTGRIAWKMFKKVHWNDLNMWLRSVSKIPGFCFLVQSESLWLSLHINPIFCYKGYLFIVPCIFIIVRIWISWSDTPLIVGGVYSTVIHKYIVLGAQIEIFWFHDAKLPCATDFMLLITRHLGGGGGCFQWDTLCLYLHKVKITL
jgi:hypothetical protein